jgi:tetratricopeptide (TPR) repeat protein
MGSSLLSVAGAALLIPGLSLAFQSPPPRSTQQKNDKVATGFRDETKLGQSLDKPVNPTLTPEMRGDIFMARKMYREAIDAYGQELNRTAVLLNKIGIAYHQMLDFDAAQKYYKRSIKANPHYAEAINNLGTIYYAKRSYRRAISEYKKALRYSPGSASILSNMGTAYFARKKYKQAMKLYQQAMAIDPQVFEHRNTAGVLLEERSVQEIAKFHYFQAKLYAQHGMTDLALESLRRALEEGFKERDKIKDEPAFASLRKLPEFQELLKLQPRVL